MKLQNNQKDFTRMVFRQLGIEHYLKSENKKYEASPERPNPFRHVIIE